MSVKIMGGVWDLELTPPQLIVLLAMADHSDHNGQNVFPSIGLLAWKTGYSIRQVRRVISQLVKTEIITPHKRPGKSTLYEIHLGKGKKKAPYDPGQDVTGQDDPGHSYVPSTPDTSEPKVVDEPSLNHQKKKRVSAPKKSAVTPPPEKSPHILLCEALMRKLGQEPETTWKSRSKGQYMAASKEMRALDLGIDDIPGLWKFLPTVNGGNKITIGAVLKHAHEYAALKKKPAPMPENVIPYTFTPSADPEETRARFFESVSS